ncbi:solute carrier family 35 member E4 [Gracilinanus agilis]|uniref:solute carrier family 35 member E4 n=1 Tax=Gracilinanus agilis TaxID=191870 RepID=UPI001CFDABAD|nr:solute carrier family 35 member E4 [Gracilinanus agilis]
MCICSRRDHEAGMSSAHGAPAATLLLPWRRAPRTQGQGEGQWPAAGSPGRVLATVLVWLATGTSMSSLNKWLFTVHGFRYPLLLSALHMLTAVLLGYPLAGHRTRLPLPARAKRRLFLLSLTFCAAVACGNLGLTYVHLDFAQMVYTTTPLFTLALSKAILGRRHHPLQYAAMGPICLGAACSILGEMHFHRTGCCFLFAATFLRGLKSVQQSEYPLPAVLGTLLPHKRQSSLHIWELRGLSHTGVPRPL